MNTFGLEPMRWLVFKNVAGGGLRDVGGLGRGLGGGRGASWGMRRKWWKHCECDRGGRRDGGSWERTESGGEKKIKSGYGDSELDFGERANEEGGMEGGREMRWCSRRKWRKQNKFLGWKSVHPSLIFKARPDDFNFWKWHTLQTEQKKKKKRKERMRARNKVVLE